jgi:hypothetical protein
MTNIFCIEQSRAAKALDPEILDLLVEHHIGIKNDRHWIIPLTVPFPQPVDDRTYMFNQFAYIAQSKGFTDLMIIK